MTLGTRAVLHTARKWKKTLLLFCLLLFITTLVLSGLAIADAQEEQAEELRGTTGASFSVERDVSTGGWTTESHGTYSTQDFITEDMIQEIASVEGITAYDASIISMPALYTESGMELPSKTWGYYIYGSINSEYNSLFLSGRFRLIDGSHITKDMENGIIISQEIAEQNGLEIGDSLTGIINPDIDDPAVDIEIVGIFDVVADKDLSANMYYD